MRIVVKEHIFQAKSNLGKIGKWSIVLDLIPFTVETYSVELIQLELCKEKTGYILA